MMNTFCCIIRYFDLFFDFPFIFLIEIDDHFLHSIEMIFRLPCIVFISPSLPFDQILGFSLFSSPGINDSIYFPPTLFGFLSHLIIFEVETLKESNFFKNKFNTFNRDHYGMMHIYKNYFYSR